MKKFTLPLTRRLFVIILLILYSLSGFSQVEDRQKLRMAIKKLDSVDVRSFRTDHFLNKGFFFGQGLGPFKKIKTNRNEEGFVLNSPDLWKAYYRGIKKSQLTTRPSGLSEDGVEQIISRYKGLGGFVPVGIYQAEGEWLKGYEIDENVKARRSGYPLAKAYDKVDIYSASVLKQKVYSGSVTYAIVPELFNLENPQKVRSIEIDPADGLGFRSIALGSKVHVEYSSLGEKAIAIKFRLAKGEFISYSIINIVTLEAEEPDLVFNMSASNNIAEGRPGQGSPPSAGGTAQLFTGCDAVFDKPVIVVEGFDPTNEISITDSRANFTAASVDQAFRASGYDMIYLDFNNGGADIRANATVLEDLIDDVNSQKSGNQAITVIGVSMGGLVARYALTDMEQSGKTHNVGDFISFDSPQLGANIPVGYQKLLEDINDVDIRDLFNIAQSQIDKAFTMLNSPAARQMVLRYKGPNPHADFNTLQNEFNGLGYPQQNGIRNVAIINGSANGQAQAPLGNFNPNNIIFQVDWVFPLASAFIKVRTNQINGTGKVSSLVILTTIFPTTVKERSYNFNAFDYDISAGGFETNQGAGGITFGWWINLFNFAEWFGNTVTDYGRNRFSFVPIFSSVGSTAPRNTHNDLNRSVNQLISNGQTPFDAIYAAAENSAHVIASDVITEWTALLSSEFSIPFTTSCQAGQGTMPSPPTPTFNTTYWYLCELESRNFWVNYTSEINNLYTHSWSLTGPINRSGSGETFTIYPSPPGYYTLRLTRSYSPSSGVTGPSSSYSRVIRVYDKNHPTYGCPDGGGGPIERTTGNFIENTDEDSTTHISVNSITVWPNPAKEGFHVAYEMKQAGNILIKLTPVIEIGQPEVIITESFRPAGVYQETFYTDYLRKGIYVLSIETNTETSQRKIIINK